MRRNVSFCCLETVLKCHCQCSFVFFSHPGVLHKSILMFDYLLCNYHTKNRSFLHRRHSLIPYLFS